MSASEKLKALEQAVELGGDFDSRPCDTAQNDAGFALTEALPQIRAVVEAAEAAERKLWHEYRREPFEPGEEPGVGESWVEGETLDLALRRLDEALP